MYDRMNGQRVHRAIYARRLVFKGKTEMHIYPTICDLVRISDTENQKRIRAGIALTRD